MEGYIKKDRKKVIKTKSPAIAGLFSMSHDITSPEFTETQYALGHH